ncbi:MAG: hypothetical protein FJ306_09780 [Planctomycetes bacterium]|nr:hypothetical protein [Planctomycetota bacterium]
MYGFVLHANTWVAPRDRDRVEALCRYAARPAVSESRLVELPDGRIGYARKRRFADGTTAVVMTNAVLMERLYALVPPPRKHLVTYHGVLAPASGPRPKVVPRQMAVGEEEAAGAAAGCRNGTGGGGVSQIAGTDNAATPATSAAAAVCRQHAERRARARARLRVPHRGSRRRSRRQRLPRGTCYGARLASTCWSARRALARGACWRRSTIQRRSRGCSRRSG